MEPLTLTLLGYPLSILASLTYDQLKKVSRKIEIDPLRKLFIDAFYASLKHHEKYYDEHSEKVVAKLRQNIKKDEKKLLLVFSRSSEDFSIFLNLVKNKKFQQKIAREIATEYSLDTQKHPFLIISIISDCLSCYISSFFNQMTEKQGIQAILLECLKLNTALDILRNLDSKIVTKGDFDDLRKTILLNYYKENSEAQKTLEDYDQYIRNKFKYLELRGFSPKISGKEVQMELLDVFVPLEINIDKTIMPNILERKTTPLRQGTNNHDNVNDSDDKKKDPITSILEKRSLVILGDPGSGKSTLLKYLTVQICSDLRNSIDLFANIVPVFFRISDYADYFKKTKKSIYEYITEHYDKQYQHLFKESFEYSNLLLLMDGLDEITDTPLRIRVTEQVMDLLARYPYNRYLVTSRIVGYQESKLGGDYKHFKLMPFRNDEIKLFSEQWYKCIAQHTDEDYKHSSEQAESLYSSILRNPSVIHLATNPLLMTIIAMIHYKGKKLPNKRVELYDISTETFLEYWVQLRMDDESQLKDKNEIIEILAPIAFDIHKNKSNALVEEKEFRESFITNFKKIHTNTSDEDARKECKEFIRFLRQQTGFFYEKGVDDEGNRFYGFIHLTFEEYLSAIELISMWNEGELTLKDYITNPRWTEIIRLAASQLRLSHKGRAGRTQSTKFLKDILNIQDSFPEARRPLQLALLILSDDVNIADEMLNTIFDNFINVISTSEFKELIESFSKLFKEILYSEHKNVFVERLEKEVITENDTLRNNIIYLLVSNSWDKDINEVLISLLDQDERISLAIYQIESRDFPFQKTECYKNTFIEKLDYLKTQDDVKTIGSRLLHNFIGSLTGVNWSNWGYQENKAVQRIIDVLDRFQDRKSFDIIFSFVLQYNLYFYLKNSYKKGLDKILQSYRNNILVTNLNKALSKLNFDFGKKQNYSSASLFQIEHYAVLLEKGDDLLIWYWAKNYGEIFYHSVVLKNIPSYIQSLKTKFSDKDIMIIKARLYSIIGPQEDACTRFIDAHEGGMVGQLYNFFGWEGYPLININLNPLLLSEIILKFAQKYIRLKRNNNKINMEDFNNDQISPPVKLLAHHILNKAYDQKLLDESILYMQSCSLEEKKGAFSILYNVLNPFELS
jgi:hypothetical protein